LPPCILHRRFPFTAGERHGFPERVRAWQRGAWASRAGSGCMGLSVERSIFLAPLSSVLVIVELIGNHRLRALVDVNMSHRLFARLVQLPQRLDCRAGIGLCLQLKRPGFSGGSYL